MVLSHKTPLWFSEAIILDIISLPGKFMTKEKNAQWHLKYVCPYCSQHRKKFRDPKRIGNSCLWQEAWKKKKWIFCRDFGLVNWIRYYFGLETDLSKFQSEYAELFEFKTWEK